MLTLKTKYYTPLGVVLVLLANVVASFVTAVGSGQIVIPSQFGWILGGVMSTIPLVLFLTNKEAATLLGPEATQIAQAAAVGNTQGIVAAGGLPASILGASGVPAALTITPQVVEVPPVPAT